MNALSASRTSLLVSPLALLVPNAADAAIQYTASGVNLWSGPIINVPVNFGGAGTKFTARGTTSAYAFTSGGIPYSGRTHSARMVGATFDFDHVEDALQPGISGSTYDPNALPPGFTVGPGIAFDDEGGETLVSVSNSTSIDDGNFGSFPGQERFLGVRFNHLGNTHYGWVGFLFTAGTPPSFVITGWAWDDTPDTPILTGDMGLVVADSPSGGGAGAAAAAAAANTQNNVRLQQQQQAAAARVARQKVAQQHRRNQQR